MSRAGDFLRRFDEADFDGEDMDLLRKRIASPESASNEMDRKVGWIDVPGEPGKIKPGTEDVNDFSGLNQYQLAKLLEEALVWQQDASREDYESNYAELCELCGVEDDPWEDVYNLSREELLQFLTHHFANWDGAASTLEMTE